MYKAIVDYSLMLVQKSLNDKKKRKKKDFQSNLFQVINGTALATTTTTSNGVTVVAGVPAVAQRSLEQQEAMKK